MREKLRGLTPYLAALGLDFYLLPVLIRDTGLAMLLMLCVMPLVAFGVGLVYGLRRGFGLWLPVLAALTFVPAIFIYYNASAWVYAPAYGVIVLAGNLIGRIFYGKR